MSMQPTYRPLLEQLESRDLLAAGITASVINNNLIVDGTTGNDYISVTQSAGKLSVYGTHINVVRVHGRIFVMADDVELESGAHVHDV